MQFITTVPMKKKWGWLFKRKQKFSPLSYPSPPQSINVGGSGKASDNMTRINIALGERGYFFS